MFFAGSGSHIFSSTEFGALTFEFSLTVTEKNPKQAGKDSSHSVVDRDVLEADRLLAAGQLQAAFLKIKAAIGRMETGSSRA